MADEEKPALEAARYEEPELEKSFAPKVPWLWIVVVPFALALAIGGYVLRERGKEADLRAALHARYATGVAAPAAPILAFRRRIEDLALERKSAPTAPSEIDPRLRISALHGVPGIYLRVRESDLESREKLAEAVLAMEPDAISRCLGIAPISARVLYERGVFIDPTWERQIDELGGVLELRVLEDQMGRHIDRDLPLLEDATQSEYLLLAIVRGDDRGDSAVDMYLIDIHARANVVALATRARAQGALLPVRTAFEGAPRGPRLPADALARSGAVDCSIAAQVKAVAGEPTMDFHSRIERPAVDAAAPAASADAGVAPAPAPAP